MECSNCFKTNEEIYGKIITEFNNHRFLVVLLLKIVLNLQKLWCNYCFCQNNIKCKMCVYAEKYQDKQYEIYENSLNFNFLNNFHTILRKDLADLKSHSRHIVCELLSREYYYEHKDWFNGKVYSYSLLHSIKIYEKDIVDENNSTKIIFFNKID